MKENTFGLKSSKRIFILKTVVVLCLLSFLTYKIAFSSAWISFRVIELVHPSFILVVVILMIFNWGLETLKWQILVKDIEYLSLKSAFKSVLAGLSSGLLTPNRIGNFIGRLAYIKKENHNQATINTLIGNLAQFISTILVGFIAMLFLVSSKFDFNHSNWVLCFSFLFICAGSYVYFKPKVVDFYPLNLLLNKDTKRSIEQIQGANSYNKFKVLMLSIMRYFIFCVQYYLLFQAFGLVISSFLLFGLIAVVFLITTLIPSLLFGKLFVRESVAVFVFSMVSIDVSLILMVSFLLWLINLAIPAVVGSVFWLKQQRYA